jgi:hypothetical protein
VTKVKEVEEEGKEKENLSEKVGRLQDELKKYPFTELRSAWKRFGILQSRALKTSCDFSEKGLENYHPI